MNVKEYAKTRNQLGMKHGIKEVVTFEYKPSKNITKFIRLEMAEHWVQFEALLIEAGYKESNKKLFIPSFQEGTGDGG